MISICHSYFNNHGLTVYLSDPFCSFNGLGVVRQLKKEDGSRSYLITNEDGLLKIKADNLQHWHWPNSPSKPAESSEVIPRSFPQQIMVYVLSLFPYSTICNCWVRLSECTSWFTRLHCILSTSFVIVKCTELFPLVNACRGYMSMSSEWFAESTWRRVDMI